MRSAGTDVSVGCVAWVFTSLLCALYLPSGDFQVRAFWETQGWGVVRILVGSVSSSVKDVPNESVRRLTVSASPGNLYRWFKPYCRDWHTRIRGYSESSSEQWHRGATLLLYYTARLAPISRNLYIPASFSTSFTQIHYSSRTQVVNWERTKALVFWGVSKRWRWRSFGISPWGGWNYLPEESRLEVGLSFRHIYYRQTDNARSHHPAWTKSGRRSGSCTS